MLNQPRRTRIPRRAAQMDPEELSPLTVKRGVILDKPRRRDTQVSDTALARASAILNSPEVSPMVTPNSSGSTRQKVHEQMLLQHFASLDIEMVYQLEDEDEDDDCNDDDNNQAEAPYIRRRRRRSYDKERADSMDMANVFYSEH